MTVIQPAGMPKAAVPLSPGVTAGGFVFVSGQTASAPDGTILCGAFDDEVNRTLDNVAAVLEAAGASFADVVKVNAYLSNSALFPRFNEIYATRFPDAVYPARTTVVLDFGHPDVRVEMDVIAHVGDRG